MKTPAYIASTEVLCCASHLIGTLAEASPGQPLTMATRASLCGDGGPDSRTVLEHWIVTDWLAEKLIENDQIVDADFAGLAIWGCSSTGQAIEADDVIVAIAEKTRA